jgi:hypothetical protein
VIESGAAPLRGTRSDAGSTATDVDAVAAAVRSCPSVADLSSGAFGQVATYLPGRRVPGVRLDPEVDGRIDVHVVGVYGIPISVLAAEVRAAVASVLPGRPVDVRVEDLTAAGDMPVAPPP